jgi:hypothetical protein
MSLAIRLFSHVEPDLTYWPHCNVCNRPVDRVFTDHVTGQTIVACHGQMHTITNKENDHAVRHDHRHPR